MMTRGRIFLTVIFFGLAGAAWWLLTVDVVTTDPRMHGGGNRVVTVRAVTVTATEFSDVVEAIGTANADESVMLTARVSEIVKSINFTDGDVVKTGTLLAKLSDDEEQAQVREAEANMREAQQQYDRIADLVKRGNASTSALDTATRRVEEARSRIQVARARLADRQIVAPFNGLLGLRQVSIGSYVSPGTAITTIDAIDTIKLDFATPERFLAVLHRGQKIEARVSAYPEEIFIGTVKTVDSRIDRVSRAVTVRAEVDNADFKLRPGMLMTVRLTAREWSGVAVPEEALMTIAGQNYIFVIGDDSIANRRVVKLGVRRPGIVEIAEGLVAGENIVTEGTLRLRRDGMKVRIVGNNNDSAPQQQRAKQ